MAAQKRTETVLFKIEPDIRDLLQRASDNQGMTLSSYLRKISIDSLMKHNLLDRDKLLAITEG